MSELEHRSENTLGEALAFYHWVRWVYPSWTDLHGWDCPQCQHNWKTKQW